MRLVYAVITDPRYYNIVITDQRPADVTVDETKGTWHNRYNLTPNPKIGNFAWWCGYQSGTVIGVYDTDNLNHLAQLAGLISSIQREDMHARMPSREASI